MFKFINIYLACSLVSFMIIRGFVKKVQKLRQIVEDEEALQAFEKVKAFGITIDSAYILEIKDDIDDFLEVYDEIVNLIIKKGFISYMMLILLMPIIVIMLTCGTIYTILVMKKDENQKKKDLENELRED